MMESPQCVSPNSEGTKSQTSVSHSVNLFRGPPEKCDCNVFQSIKKSHECDSSEPIQIPCSANGYLDPISGRQVGSFMTYVITFGVNLLWKICLLFRNPLLGGGIRTLNSFILIFVGHIRTT